MEFYSDEKGMELGLFKVDAKGKTYIEVSHYNDSDKEKIYEMLSEITEKTPEREVINMFSGVECNLKTKSFFAKKRNILKGIDLLIYTVCGLIAFAAYVVFRFY